ARRDALAREALLCLRAVARGDAPIRVRVREERGEAVGEARGVRARRDDTVHAVDEQFAERALRPRDDRQAVQHRLEDGVRQTFGVAGGEQEDARLLERAPLRFPGHVTEELHEAAARALDVGPDLRLVLAGARDPELERRQPGRTALAV